MGVAPLSGVSRLSHAFERFCFVTPVCLSSSIGRPKPQRAILGTRRKSGHQITEMTKRSIFTFLLVLAFPAGAWGNVFAAAFCPHLGSTRACCLRQASQSPPSSNETHHDMGDMQMGDMQMDPPAVTAGESCAPRTVSNGVAQYPETALELPADTCAHCISHSQLTSTSFVVSGAESTKSHGLTAPQTPAQDSAVPNLRYLLLERRGHAPPGETFPRYLFINIFRI